MPQRLTLIAPAIVAVCFVALCIVSVALTTKPVQAQSSCLSAPNATAPEGRWWYYRVDRTTGRRCWYLAEKGKRVRPMASQITLPARRPATRASQEAAARAAQEPASPEPASQEPASSESTQPAPASPRSAATANAMDPAMQFSRRWPNGPDSIGVVRTVPMSPRTSYAEETTSTVGQQGGDTPSAWPGHAAAERAANDVAAASTVRLEHMLALLAAALALAGIIMSLLYAIGSMRRRPSPAWDITADIAADTARVQLPPFRGAGYHPAETVRQPAPQRRMAEREPRDPALELALQLQDLSMRRAALARRRGA